jgi:ribosomal protein S18 acetylase RimI-like enzyme
LNAATATDRDIRLLRHRRGAPALRLGLGPRLLPAAALKQLQHLFNQNCFWAQSRSLMSIQQMLMHSDVVVSAWRGRQLVGFGRATSDGIFRGVLWDVVVASTEEGRGLGRSIVTALLQSKSLIHCERVYLMTSHSKGFYERLGFQEATSQHLLVRIESSGQQPAAGS